MPESPSPAQPGLWGRSWPWLTLLVMTAPAFWYLLDFESDLDGEFPKVLRQTFSARPAPAYRLAEAGDTIDRVGIYLSSLALALCVRGLTIDRANGRRWVAAFAVSLAAFWYAANPGPTYDGWHGIGWYAAFNADSPTALRAALFAGMGLLAGLVVWGLDLHRGPAALAELRRDAAHNRVWGLLILAVSLAAIRPFEVPGVEPEGFYPRWAFMLGLIAFASALVRLQPAASPRRAVRAVRTVGVLGVWAFSIWGGIWLTWYHRPIDRLRTVVPGRIYMSGMPTPKGLPIAHARHQFKTIINLFPEDSSLQSPLYPNERRFAAANGINYVLSPSDVAESDAFLDETLRLAQDPSAWPILVHCHACMDRTPAWVGIYRFVVEGRPLNEIMTFIERHRGYRPKASVTLLYNRVLPRLAPERCQLDPTVALLKANAEGTRDPYYDELTAALARANRGVAGGVSGEAATAAGSLPSLTPRR